jgi:hypothetical protein
VQAVLEAKGEQAAQAIASLKKGEMAEKAEVLLALASRRNFLAGVADTDTLLLPINFRRRTGGHVAADRGGVSVSVHRIIRRFLRGAEVTTLVHDLASGFAQ